MKGPRGTPMVAKPSDVLDRTPSTARRWAGPDAPDHARILPPDDDHAGRARHGAGARGTAPPRAGGDDAPRAASPDADGDRC